MYCIAISGEGRSEFHLLYAKSIMERRMWAQKILETVVPVFLPKYTSEFTLAGWAYLKAIQICNFFQQFFFYVFCLVTFSITVYRKE